MLGQDIQKDLADFTEFHLNHYNAMKKLKSSSKTMLDMLKSFCKEMVKACTFHGVKATKKGHPKLSSEMKKVKLTKDEKAAQEAAKKEKAAKTKETVDKKVEAELKKKEDAAKAEAKKIIADAKNEAKKVKDAAKKEVAVEKKEEPKPEPAKPAPKPAAPAPKPVVKQTKKIFGICPLCISDLQTEAVLIDANHAECPACKATIKINLNGAILR